MWNATLPLIGVVIGGLMQYVLSRSTESSKQQILLQHQAYVDYLRAVVKSAFATSVELARLSLADAVDAKARLSIYGSDKVIASLARFERGGSVLDNSDSVDRFLEVVIAMRTQAVSKADLKSILLGSTRNN